MADSGDKGVRGVWHIREFPEAVLYSEELWLVDVEEALTEQGSTAAGEDIQWLQPSRGGGHTVCTHNSVQSPLRLAGCLRESVKFTLVVNSIHLWLLV